MTALRATLLGSKFGLPLAAVASAIVARTFPTFFTSPGELVATALLLALAVALVGGLAGLFMGITGIAEPARGRTGGAIGSALGGLIAAAGLAFVFLPTPSPAAIAACAVGTALVAFRIASRPRFETGAATGLALLVTIGSLAAGATAKKAPAATATGHDKVLIFGLDAGTWTILDELFANDELPNLRRLRDEGSSGKLHSELQSFSPRVWTTIASGKNPEKHGVLDFQSTQNQNLKVRRVWEILQARGWSVGLFQWLITWPPDPFDPFIVPAWMARGPETQPAGLRFIKELELSVQNGVLQGWWQHDQKLHAITKLRDWGVAYLRHGVRMTTLLRAAQAWFGSEPHPQHGRYAGNRMVQLLLNGDVYLELYRTTSPDFSCCICYGTDNLAHKFWQYHFPDDFGIPHEKAAPWKNVLTDYYRAADTLLGEVIAETSERTTIAVVSDHGFTSRGFAGDSHQSEHRPRMAKLAQLLQISDTQASATSVATHGYLRPLGGSAEARAITDRTLAFLDACTTQGGATKVFSPRRLPTGELDIAMNLAGDFTLTTPITTPAGAMTYGDLADIEERAGNHSLDGIVLLRGPAIRRGVRFEDGYASLQDITPTLLYLHGQPIGADMDGKVLLDAIDESFRSEHDVERIESWDSEVGVTRDTSVVGDDRALKSYTSDLGYTERENNKPSRPQPDGESPAIHDDKKPGDKKPAGDEK